MAIETAQNKRIVLGCDHAGFALKSVVAQYLIQQGYDVQDVGCFSESDRVDYPSIAEEVARLMQSSGIEKGIITCGSGVGVAIAANRFPWVRAVHAHDAYLAQLSREHNDSNVLCMGGRFVSGAYGTVITQAWLNARFEGDRHERRVGMLSTLKA
jgi:ribose 5-phosphate isomerase B